MIKTSTRAASADRARMNIFFIIALSLFSIGAFATPTRINLQYDRVLIKQGFASPIIDISINGRSGRFLVDSGAAITVVSKSFAEKAKIKTVGESTVGGSSGGSSQSSLGKADLLVKSSRGKVWFRNMSLVMVPLPDTFEDNNLAGILSPQQFLNGQKIGVLNLGKSASFEVYNEFIELEEPSFPLNVVSANGPGGTRTTLFTINALVADTLATFIVDTGADGAGIGEKTSAGAKLLSQSIPTSEKVGGINGAPVEVRIVPRATVHLLGRNLEMKLRLQPISGEMPADGMLGMQFLKNCHILLSSTRASIACP